MWHETFAIAQTKKPLGNAFAVIQGKTEITVIMDQKAIPEDKVFQMDRDWKLISFDQVLPLQTIGFLAKVTTALADSHISVCALSAYSTDHILVKAHNLRPALRKLETLGFKIPQTEPSPL